MLTGNLGRDPEQSRTADGKSVSRFTLAVNCWVKSSGDRQQETDWYNVTAWDNWAEVCRMYLKKGHKVFIEGRLRQHRYTDLGGVQRVSLDVNVDGLEMLTPKGEGPVVQPSLPLDDESAAPDDPEEDE